MYLERFGVRWGPAVSRGSPFGEAAVGVAPDRIAPAVAILVGFANRVLVADHRFPGPAGRPEPVRRSAATPGTRSPCWSPCRVARRGNIGS